MTFKNTIAKIKSKFGGRPTFLVDPISPIKEAFISGGTTYYMFEDIFAMPSQRALEATTYYEEMKSKISKEYLTEYLEAMTETLSNPKGINLSTIVLLNNTLKERNELIMDSDIIFKLASVLYFDKNENPYRYDMKYNHNKIKNWKANEDVASFFFRTPIKSFLGYMNMSEKDLSSYLQIAEKVKTEHLKILMEAKRK